MLNKENSLIKDKNKVIQVLKKIDVDCPDPEKYIRLSKYNSIETLPKISFKSKDNAITLLRKKHTLKIRS